MSLSPGTRVGVYEVTALLGTGGMGEVYRARDTKLNRDVALKILPDIFAGDRERVARFEHEAKTLASLNHPHIAHIHGFEQAGSTTALVMELVEGEDLAERLKSGPMPIDEAIPIAHQIAEGLEAAHEQGIIHRDLKPANIKVRPDGTVKILDFGLAKALTGSAGSTSSAGSFANSPTITSPMTIHGVILGTAAYMSPEQARGRRIDRRTDVWAFGVVLFEMLTGRRPFAGEDAAEVIGAVIHKEPDWTLLPAAIPPATKTVLKCCLEKDPGRRLRDMGDVRLALSGEFESRANAADSGAMAIRSSPWRTVAISGALALIATVVTALAMWSALRPDPARVARFAITPPAPGTLTSMSADRNLAISPDGSQIVYTGNNGTQMWRWPLDRLEPVVLASGTAPRGPFFSPDGQSVAFFDGQELKRVAITGGPAVTICKVPDQRQGGTWAGDAIVFATGDPQSGLWRVAAAGGEPQMLTRPDPKRSEADHVFPSFLPGGTSVLFTITSTSGSIDEASIALLDLKAGTYKTVLKGGSHALYSPTGHLVYGAEGSLRAVSFNLSAASVSGSPAPAVADVQITPTGAVDFDLAGNGTMVYMPSAADPDEPRSMMWIDRSGRLEPLRAPRRGYTYAYLSPDGTRVAADVRDDGNSDIWIFDIARETLTRLTFEPVADTYPTWSIDSKRVFFVSGSGRDRNLFWQAADGTGAREQLTDSGRDIGAPSVSPDGQFLIFPMLVSGAGANPEGDLASIRLGGSHHPEVLLTTPLDERNAAVSPDGKWIAYEARDTTAFSTQVFVRPFPDVNSGRWQVSTTNGRSPSWSRNGRELFYLSGESQRDAGLGLMSVPIQPGPTWSAGTAVKLFNSPALLGRGGAFRTYDPSPDGQRFLVIGDTTRTAAAAAPRRLVIVQNFFEELRGIRH